MTTVGVFSKPEEAHLLRCRLESAGIAAQVRDEAVVQMNWLLSNAIGGVKVDVPDSQAEAAREVIASPPLEQTSEAEFLCPRCGSAEVTRREWPKRLAYLSLLLANFPLLLSRKHLKCGKCGHAWR